jgi:hypothetical protein
MADAGKLSTSFHLEAMKKGLLYVAFETTLAQGICRERRLFHASFELAKQTNASQLFILL